jgi:hypothetical protein
LYEVVGITEMKEKEKIPHCRNNFKINIKIVERGKIDTPSKQDPHRPISVLGKERK